MIIFTMIGLVGAILLGYFFMSKTAFVISLVIIAHLLKIPIFGTINYWMLLWFPIIVGLGFGVIRDLGYIGYRLKTRRKAREEKKAKEKKEGKDKEQK